MELVLLSRAMTNLADDDEEITWAVRTGDGTGHAHGVPQPAMRNTVFHSEDMIDEAARLLELVLLGPAMSNLPDADEVVTWPPRNCHSFGGVLLELAPGEHTAACCVVSTSASALEQIKKAVSTVLKSGAHEDFSFVSDALRALPPLLRAIAALEWMSDAVELEERTPLDCSPLERQAAQVLSSLEEAARLLRAYQDFTEVPHLLSEIAQAGISAAELLVLCCARPMKLSTLQTRGCRPNSRNGFAQRVAST